ncbi:DUF5681 domain-containing protein [Oceanibium sediminis]|uniref:DUF5681 domain-containing protein n=1 Tax=Oceanibium sediminis TaxID=2026339 RepID=UPI00130083A0|nr:DUF5681 domain-containing protein [Oceanibium sediminis]
MGKKPPRQGYDVSYGKPPKHTHFKPGRSGNPSGKKRGTPDLRTMIQTIGAELITVMEGGAKKQIQKNAAVVKAVYAKAVNERSKLTRFQRLNLTHLLWRKAPGGPPSYSESVWGLCLRDGYVFLRRLLCANRYEVLPVSMIAQ